jgi:hypothetical protein
VDTHEVPMAIQNYPSHPRNVLGAWYTTGHCLACGAPEAEARALLPAVESGELETYFVRRPVTEAEVEQACRASQVCCVNSLRYSGRDRRIIRRLGNTAAYSDYIITRLGRLKRAGRRGSTA